MNWKPILNQVEREKSWELLSLLEKSIAEELDKLDSYQHQDISLLNGKGGACLFYFYYYQLTQDGLYAEKTMTLLAEMLDVLEYKILPYRFSSGHAGVGWLLSHIANNSDMLCRQDVKDFLSTLDPLIIDASKKDLELHYYDYLHGGLGGILYAIEVNTNYELMNYVVDLFQQYQEQEGGWRVRHYVNNEGSLIKLDDSIVSFNLGLSHGNPSIISILAMIAHKGIKTFEIKKMIYKNVDWLFQQTLENENSLFPSQVNDNKESNSTNLSWCYGDLGIAASLLQIAQIFEDKELAEKAIKLAERCARRLEVAQNFKVGHLCHGTLGNAHIFNRFYQISSNPIFEKAIQIWLERTFELINNHGEEAPIYNFIMVDSPLGDDEKQREWYPDFSFLEGLPGMGLALISLLSEIEPKWDRALLLN